MFKFFSRSPSQLTTYEQILATLKTAQNRYRLAVAAALGVFDVTAVLGAVGGFMMGGYYRDKQFAYVPEFNQECILSTAQLMPGYYYVPNCNDKDFNNDYMNLTSTCLELIKSYCSFNPFINMSIGSTVVLMIIAISSLAGTYPAYERCTQFAVMPLARYLTNAELASLQANCQILNMQFDPTLATWVFMTNLDVHKDQNSAKAGESEDVAIDIDAGMAATTPLLN